MSKLIKALAKGRTYHPTKKDQNKANGWMAKLDKDNTGYNYPSFEEVNECIKDTNSVVFVDNEDDLIYQLEHETWINPHRVVFVCTPERRVFLCLGEHEYSYKFSAVRLNSSGKIIRNPDSDDLSNEAFEIFIDELIDEGRDFYDEDKR